ncbi:MAG: thiamine pyrophosphate-dependent enzyme [Defluviitaleaceae bacterium]|nr:thiamine pyrophosphate-dependent enzyme [Defluviitaleaceae bacterium]
MAYNLKEWATRPERLTGGHRLCAGCGATPVVRTVLRALKPEDHAVVSSATCCLEVSSFLYPYTAWKDSFIHSAFENVAATISGVEAVYKAKLRKGENVNATKFIAFAGDGGTYDIGLQALSGAMERGHDMMYVCYDNGAYMNTGIQRSGASPKYSDTSTTPAGKTIPGKVQHSKNLTQIIMGHNIPYVAQTMPLKNFKDLSEKAEKGIYTPGAAFLNVLAPCPRGWRYDTALLMEMCELALETCVWPIYEIIEGKLTLNYIPKEKKPIEEYLKPQGRFSHMFKPGNEWMIEDVQSRVDREWEKLLNMNEMK